MLKKFIPATAAIALLAAFTVSGARADVQVSASSAILMEASTGTVLYEKSPDDRRLIASTTKLMTALVALENANLSELVTVPAVCETIEGSSMYLRAGEKLTMRELLYGLMLESGNDAAVAVACHIAGSVEGFAKLMNDRAASLGLQNTHFVNPHGLNADGHYSSARDLALIMRACMNDPLFAQIASTKTVSFGERTFTNHNKLMWSYEGMLAGKTGYTKMAGRTLVTCAERNGLRLICVTLNDGDDWADHEALYDMGFAGWELQTPVKAGDTLGAVPVISGLTDAVSVRAASGVSILTKAGEELGLKLELPKFVYAKVSEGESAGTAEIIRDGETVATVELVYANTVERDSSQEIRPLERLKDLILLRHFITPAIITPTIK